MAFTLDKLAQALRGMPRNAVMLIQLPDGTLAEIDYIKPMHLRARDDGSLTADSSGRPQFQDPDPHYGIALIPKVD